MFIFNKNTAQKDLKDYSFFSDQDLIKKYKTQNDNECIGELFKRYTYLVYGICMKYLKNETESEDAVMKIFEELFDKLKNHDIDNFKNWIYSVSKNYCLMFLRKDKTKKTKDDMYFRNIEKNIMEFLPEIHLNNKEEKNNIINKLHQALDNLKEEQKNCLILMYLKNKSYKEVSEITGYTLKEVKSFIQNGKRNLKNDLGEINEF